MMILSLSWLRCEFCVSDWQGNWQAIKKLAFPMRQSQGWVLNLKGFISLWVWAKFSSRVKRQRLSLECTSLQPFRVIVNWHWSHCHGAFVFNAAKFENSCLDAARSLSPTFVIDASHQLSIFPASFEYHFRLFQAAIGTRRLRFTGWNVGVAGWSFASVKARVSQDYIVMRFVRNAL